MLYEDPELGFCICGHVYETPAHGQPPHHDPSWHGPSWAIYGLAVGDTEMTGWRIVKKGDGEATDDPELKGEGKLQEAKGKVQKAVGDAKSAIKKAADL